MRTRWCVTIFLYCLYEELTVSAFNLEPRIPIVKKGPPNSYFGYSVAEHVIVSERLRQKYTPKVLVGAPKAQGKQNGTINSGAIFNCPLSSREKDCEMLRIDDEYTVGDDEFKNDQWLGVTLKSQGLGGFVMTCAHRYVKKGRDYRWGTGICYSLTQNLDQDNVFEPCSDKPKTRAHEQYGYCQVGTSGAITEENDIVLGTPGPYTWRGTIFTNSIAQKLRDDKAWYMGAVLDHTAPVDKYSYLGMSVTSGKFFKNKISYIAGAPRAGNTGQVIFFSKQQSRPILEVDVTLKGEVFASSYGYEVAAADLNGDGLPDLIVGAPFYYGEDGGGAIYIYYNSDVGINENTKYQRIAGSKEGEPRFGFAIANCKDFNKDNIEDIAVGAPYEENGYVYIFLGSKNGIIKEPAQIIKAEDIPVRGLRSFGYSLSGGIDLDSNNYPDLVVGAYESDTVLVLRTRPIIHIVSSILGDLTNIDPSSPQCKDEGSDRVCFSFEACFTIEFNDTGNNPPLNLNYSIEAETFTGKRSARVYFEKSKNTENKNIVYQTISLPARRVEHSRCTKEVVFVNPENNDILTPIRFKLTYALLQDTPRMPVEGARLPDINHFPILDQQEAVRIFSASFEKDCGDKDFCESDLDLSVSLHKDREFILGSENEISLTISILNRGDSAYEAGVYVFIPPSLVYQGQDDDSKIKHACDTVPGNNTVVFCPLGNPFRRSTDFTRIVLQFYPANVKDTDTSLMFIVKANSTSQELHKTDPIVDYLSVKRVADLSIQGKAGPDHVLYSGEVRGESVMKTEDDVGKPLYHRYVITNKGPSYVSSLYVNISWPYEIENHQEHGKWLLYLMEKPKIVGAIGDCAVDERHVNTLKLEASPSATLGSQDFHQLISTIDIDKSERTDETHGGSAGGGESGREEGHEIEGGGGGFFIHEEKHEVWTEHKTQKKWRQNFTTTYEERSEHHSSTSGRRKREATPEAESLTDSSKVVFDCLDGTARCFTIQCHIRNVLADPNLNINIWLRGRLWSSTFVAEFPDKERVVVRSRANLYVDTIPEIKQKSEDDDHSFAETVAVPDLPPSQKTKKVPIWVYILAAFFGLFLLVLVVLCLWKLGFFKRKTPSDTMKANLEKQNDFNSRNY